MTHTGVLTRVLHLLRYAPRNALHRSRRERARELVLACQPTSVLFLCQGNACRSPFAAAVFAAAIEARAIDWISVQSAGLVAPGRPSPPQAIQEAARRGVDLLPHRSRLVTAQAIRGTALTVVMSPGQARAVSRVSGASPTRVIILGDLDPEPAHKRTIADPIGGPDSLFVESFARIERCVRELVALIASGGTRAGPPADGRPFHNTTTTHYKT